MSMPLRVSMRIGTHLMKQKLSGNKKFPLLVELEPLFACNLKCNGCGKIQHPANILKQRMSVEQAVGGDRGGQRADGLDRRRRAADAPADRGDRAGADQAEEVRLPLHERAAAAQAPAQVQAVAVLPLGGAHRRPARAARRVGVQGGRVRPGGRGHQDGEGGRVQGQHQHHLLQHRHPADRHRRARLPQRRARGRRPADLPRIRLREGPRPGALPRRRRRPARCSARRSRTAAGRSGG